MYKLLHIKAYTYSEGKNFSLEFKFSYFANGKFAKYNFRLSL